MRVIISLLVILVIALAAVWYLYRDGRIASSYVPWAPLDLRASPGPFTEYKLNALKNDLPRCEAALSRAGIGYTTIPDQEVGTCELQERVSLDQGLYPYSAPVRATCPLVATLALWEREVVQKMARRYLGEEVARIEHLGIFSCRNVRGSSSRRSQHASANAIDISGFRLKSGKLVSVRQDWGKQRVESTFLHEVHDASCGLFRGVLGPEYNAAHADHFHLDLGPYSICR
jgi:hypothetical protein